MKFTLTILAFFLSIILFGQTADNTQRRNESNIYYQALSQYLKHINSNENLTPETIFIEDDFRFTDSLLLQSGQTKFIKLTLDSVRHLLKSKKSFILYRIYPLRFVNEEFSVSFVPFKVTRDKKNKNINYANPGSYRVVFKFDNNRFHFLRVEDHGI